MKVLVLRHGPAGNAEAWSAAGKPEKARPLTPAGLRKMETACAGIKRLLPELGVIATSDCVRASQTAGLLRRHYPRAKLVELKSLRPGYDIKDTLEWLSSQSRGASVALVGHEPACGRLASRLLCGEDACFLRFKKGAAALLETTGPAKPGHATLLWLLQPKGLRAMGNRGR
ncbi:MAG: hypothetical protein WC728_00150 [Elusimicrobiota bacterium]